MLGSMWYALILQAALGRYSTPLLCFRQTGKEKADMFPLFSGTGCRTHSLSTRKELL